MRSTEILLASIAALSGTALLGCGSDNTTPDAAVVSGTDAPAPATPRVVVGTRAMNMPANFACAGSNTAPMGGADVMGSIEFQALALMSFPVAMGDVEVFSGAAVGAPGSGTAGTTDADGLLEVTLPSGGWFSYRMAQAGAGSTLSVPVLGMFYEWGTTDGATVTVTAISQSVAGILTDQLNRTLTSTTAAVSGSMNDCDAETVANVQVRFFRGDTEIVSGPADDTASPRIVGLNDNAVPAPTPNGLTAFAGRFAGLVPAAGGAVRVEAYGVTEEGGSPVLIGCEEVLVEPGTVSVAVIPALRSDADYGAGHPCVGRAM